MWTRQHKKRNTGRLIVPGITALFLAYFGFHIYHGEYGINSKAQYETRMAELRLKLESVRERRLELEGRVRVVQDGTLERDMLDVQARRALSVSRPDEVTIMLPDRFAN